LHIKPTNADVGRQLDHRTDTEGHVVRDAVIAGAAPPPVVRATPEQRRTLTMASPSTRCIGTTTDDLRRPG
jgi:hypothetical protein